MPKSMTGYGRGEAETSAAHAVVEIRTVNHRFLDISVRSSKDLMPLEDRIRRRVSERIGRGRADIYISVEENGNKRRNVEVDTSLASAYVQALRDLAGISGMVGQEVSIGLLAGLPEVLTLRETPPDLEELWTGVDEALNAALDGLTAQRRDEGENLSADLRERCGLIADLLAKIEARSPEVVQEYREKLAARIADFLPAGTVDEQRLAQEAAIFADRSSIVEETVRLRSHLGLLGQLLADESDQAVGRKVDFLLQEMNREVNTIGSKANDAFISQTVVQIKAELEKVREQAQNIE